MGFLKLIRGTLKGVGYFLYFLMLLIFLFITLANLFLLVLGFVLTITVYGLKGFVKITYRIMVVPIWTGSHVFSFARSCFVEITSLFEDEQQLLEKGVIKEI